MDKRILKKLNQKNDKDKINVLELELSTTKYNKRSQHHIGLVKAKIRKLKDKETKRASQKSFHDQYSVKKSGHATVIIIGFPSVGKSTLLNAITDADSKVGAYDFTTLRVIPGLLDYGNAKIQILDMPGIVQGAADGTGRGREVLSVMRNADMVLFLIDANHPEHLRALQHEVYEAHLRVNAKKPDITITKKEKGGIDVGFTVKQKFITREMVVDILKEFGICNAQVIIRELITPEKLMDVIEANKIYIPGIVVVNKIDMISGERLNEIKKLVKPDLCISADKRINLDELKELIFKRLNLIRVYCKESGKKPDLNEPVVLRSGATLKDFCEKLHRDFVARFKFAKIWGSSKFPGQDFRKLERELLDGDIVELHLN